ncbi:PTS N-acetylglucosamine transporter subunit IIBC [uncultured Lactobacillus sp.]|uniref:PTS sugar transporter subunit IIA n=1 Tax=uncultured Lactobacillus sp. TaxID=153152 RepID=UPI0025D26A4E|nr:PTS N-acetylglucosamine transporter subunit IIBC [uncultured Lactobacillus sp.]
MSQFIIATHSYLADGYKHSIKFFNTEVKNIHFINAYTEEKNNFVEELEKLLNEFEDEQVIILTDLPGGSVNKESASLIKQYNCNVISGINLSLVLELVLSSDEVLTDEKIRAAVEQARSQIVFMNDLLKGDDL